MQYALILPGVLESLVPGAFILELRDNANFSGEQMQLEGLGGSLCRVYILLKGLHYCRHSAGAVIVSDKLFVQGGEVSPEVHASDLSVFDLSGVSEAFERLRTASCSALKWELRRGQQQWLDEWHACGSSTLALKYHSLGYYTGHGGTLVLFGGQYSSITTRERLEVLALLVVSYCMASFHLIGVHRVKPSNIEALNKQYSLNHALKNCECYSAVKISITVIVRRWMVAFAKAWNSFVYSPAPSHTITARGFGPHCERPII
jgi:hypothetical protein